VGARIAGPLPCSRATINGGATPVALVQKEGGSRKPLRGLWPRNWSRSALPEVPLEQRFRYLSLASVAPMSVLAKIRFGGLFARSDPAFRAFAPCWMPIAAAWISQGATARRLNELWSIQASPSATGRRSLLT